MSNCGCKPCKQNITSIATKCETFSVCIGNKTLTFDGTCISLSDRQYKIPDGTFTSVTFEGGCIVGVGQAPIPVYTPQACCDGESTSTTTSSTSIKVSPSTKNLATITNGVLSVEPIWDTSGLISVNGTGSADSPWKPTIKLSNADGNVLTSKSDGLYAQTSFKTSDTVTVTGKGTSTDPFKFDVKQPSAKLDEINKENITGNGYTITKTGLIKADNDLTLVTNLTFDNSAFTVVDRGDTTLVMVDDTKLKTGSSIKTGDGLTGVGTTADPLKLNLTVSVVSAMLDVISKDDTLKQKLKGIIGV